MEHMSNPNPSPFSAHRQCHHATPYSKSNLVLHRRFVVQIHHAFVVQIHRLCASSTYSILQIQFGHHHRFVVQIHRRFCCSDPPPLRFFFFARSRYYAALAIPVLVWAFTAALSFISSAAFIIQIHHL
ncbi:hypothetical protein PIB30_071434 [Stylosanthes scabra]|uniref:Uncharacterized protein n=1 Tax=Stylosanthes scabra TaxID=79078 RepID=A0ABU6TR38_9FABA|nr:hypothetical protein [Stylosanthes scabra]